MAKKTMVMKTTEFDLRKTETPWPDRHAEGKALRTKVPRESFAAWKPPANRRDPIKTLIASNKGRQSQFIPLRMGRMACSPFAFLRGAACIMAGDLAVGPNTGIDVIIDGDAHLNNFGLYGTPQREIIFDLNDFDETTKGPWEWDLKRLVASVNVAARENGMNRKDRQQAVMDCVSGYQSNATRLESMGVLDTWYLHAYPGRSNPIVRNVDPKAQAVINKCIDKARRSDNHALLAKITSRQTDGAWRFREDPPILTKVSNKVRESVIDGLNLAATTMLRERRFMLSRYHVADVCHRVVGVGSVGTRAYLVLLFGNSDDDPLFLQVKEATEPAHSPYLPNIPEEFRHNGKRVVFGQRALQASSDVMLGYTQIDGRDFFVRQMKNLKASIPVEWLSGAAFNFYALACGALLARAHARCGDAAKIAGYCGNSGVLGQALAEWAESYGDQTVKDHAALLEAIKNGTIEADQSESGTE
jgi:uncharacterized protein (DUF2252 family)